MTSLPRLVGLALAAGLMFAFGAGSSARAAAGPQCSGQQLALGAGWTVCWEIRAHEGLVITDAFFGDGEAMRRVLSGAAIAQVFVPFDAGQPRYHDVAYGMGPAMQGLPAEACDGSLLADGRVCRETVDRSLAQFFCSEGDCRARVGISMALWSSSQMGAYNYLTRWTFMDDGVIEPALGITGVLPLGGAAHTHNVYWRLDLDMDDPGGDRVEEFFRIKPAWSDGLEGASGWAPLLAETYRGNDAATFRRWRVADAHKTNANGSPIAYELDPTIGDGSFRSVAEEGYTRGEFWVTRARDSERFVSTEEADLLSSYLNGESVADADVVVWYVAHALHEVRDEDRPYMSTRWVSFQLRPNGFLNETPGDR